MTRKYTTAETFTETLSRVMMSCCGTSCTIVRSDTRTIVSNGQKMNVNPGPFGVGDSRPSQNVTARSYSFRMLIHFMSTISATIAATMVPWIIMEHRPFDGGPRGPCSGSGPAGRPDDQREPVLPDDPHRRAGRDRHVRARVPVLAVREDAPRGSEIGHRAAALPDQSLGSGADGPGADRHGAHRQRREDPSGEQGPRKDDADVHPVAVPVPGEEEEGAGDEHRDAGEREHSVHRELKLGDDEEDSERDQAHRREAHG